MAKKPPRVIVLANVQKPSVSEAMRELRPWLAARAKVVAEPDLVKMTPEAAAELPRADFGLVLGGDGTILGQARHLLDLDLPLVGVNFGRLGFLAEFSLEQLHTHWESIAAGKLSPSKRLMIEALVFDSESSDCLVGKLDMEHCVFRGAALNEVVITAGEPFRLVEMEMTIDPTGPHADATQFSGDGVIVSTPSGSTAYNLSAGGPIVSADLDAFCITPICPHSLAFRPILVKADASIRLRLKRANVGTTMVMDGQVPVKVATNQQIFIRRNPKPLLLIHNPELNYWKMLAQNMHWAASPRRG